MKNSVSLHISRNKSYLDIVHKGELIGKIEVAESNRTNTINLRFVCNAEDTRFNIKKDESFYNKEEFNR